MDFHAVVLSGGTGARLGGVDKAALLIGGRTLLDHALAALSGAVEIVVVGPPAAYDGERPVRFVREDPPLGGPAAGLIAGALALPETAEWIAVAAVDMPGLRSATYERLLSNAASTAGTKDGAVLIGPDGRRQLALVVRRQCLLNARPDGGADGLPMHRLLGALDLAEVPAVSGEHRDVDTWADLGS